MPKFPSIFLMAFAGAAAATAMLKLRKKEGAKSLQPPGRLRRDGVATTADAPARHAIPSVNDKGYTGHPV